MLKEKKKRDSLGSSTWGALKRSLKERTKKRRRRGGVKPSSWAREGKGITIRGNRGRKVSAPLCGGPTSVNGPGQNGWKGA